MHVYDPGLAKLREKDYQFKDNFNYTVKLKLASATE